MAAEREREDFSRTEKEEIDGHFATDSERIPPRDEAERVERETSSEEAVLKFCSIFQNIALELVNEKAKEKSKTSFD